MKPAYVGVLAAVGLTFGQTRIDLKTQTRNVDFSRAVSVRPFPMGTVLPGTCNTGEMFFKSDAPAGANLYGCVAANVWAPMPQSSENSGSGVPYTGATMELDLGTYGLKAAYIDLTGGGAWKMDIVQGPCPDSASTGADYTLCMESGVMQKVSAGGVKTVVNIPAGTCASGQHLDGINADLTVHCTADSGGSGGGFDPLDFASPWSIAWFPFQSEYRYTSGCSGSVAGWGGLGASRGSVTPWNFFATIGDASICAWTSVDSNYGLKIYDFASGSNPITHTAKARFKVGDRDSDVYFGYSLGSFDANNFFGCRALKTDVNWQAVIISGGTASTADTGVPIVASTGDGDHDYLLEVGNSGVANSIICKVNGTPGTVAATIPGGGWKRIIGVEQRGASVSTFALSWIGWRFSAVGSIH